MAVHIGTEQYNFGMMEFVKFIIYVILTTTQYQKLVEIHNLQGHCSPSNR